MTDYSPIVLLVIVGLVFLAVTLLRRRLSAEDVEDEYRQMLREIADADPALKEG